MKQNTVDRIPEIEQEVSIAYIPMQFKSCAWLQNKIINVSCIITRKAVSNVAIIMCSMHAVLQLQLITQTFVVQY